MNDDTQQHDEPVEIERKYLLSRCPELPPDAVAHRIAQGYLPDDDPDSEGRVRRKVAPDGTERFTHTIKRGRGVVRTEIERTIDTEEFEKLWRRTEGRRLTKVRHQVPAGELVWEIDVFDEIDVVLAEIELPTATTEVEPPDWLRDVIVREVTDEATFRNYELACKKAARP